MFISRSLRRKVLAALLTGATMVLLYEATVYDSRDAAGSARGRTRRGPPGGVRGDCVLPGPDDRLRRDGPGGHRGSRSRPSFQKGRSSRSTTPRKATAASTRCSTPARRSRDTTWTSTCGTARKPASSAAGRWRSRCSASGGTPATPRRSFGRLARATSRVPPARKSSPQAYSIRRDAPISQVRIQGSADHASATARATSETARAAARRSRHLRLRPSTTAISSESRSGT